MKTFIFLLCLVGTLAFMSATRPSRGPYDVLVQDDHVCVTVLDQVLEELYSLCAQQVVSGTPLASVLDIMKRISNNTRHWYAARSSQECAEYAVTHPDEFMGLYREFNHVHDDCRLPTTQTSSNYTAEDYLFAFVHFVAAIEDSVTWYCQFVYGFVGWFGVSFVEFVSSLGWYDWFVVSLGMISPAFPLAYLALNNFAFMLVIPLFFASRLDLRLLWVVFALNVFFPTACILVVLFMVPFTVYRLRQRRPEGLREMGYTALFFASFGAYLELAFFLYPVYPSFLWVGCFFFLILALVLFWARRRLVVEYTITSWQNGTAGPRSKPFQIEVEVDFPFTLLQPLNRVKLWFVGIPWTHVQQALAQYFGPALVTPGLGTGFVYGGAVVPTAPGTSADAAALLPGTAPTIDDVAARFPAAAAPRTGAIYGPRGAYGTHPPASTSKKPLVDWDDASVEWVRSRGLSLTQEALRLPAWEAKGKTKTGRGKWATIPKGAPTVNFRRVKSQFWMSDPDVDVEYIRRWDGEDFRYIDVADWDALQGYLEIIDADGTIQHVFYEPNDPWDEEIDPFTAQLYAGMDGGRDTFEANTRTVKPGDAINLSQVRLKRKVRSDDSLARQVSELTLLVKTLAQTVGSMRESNGTISSLPTPPASVFTNPLEPYKPHGCMHHTKCKIASTTTPCNKKCAGTACVHNSACVPVSSEAFPAKYSPPASKIKAAPADSPQLIANAFFCKNGHLIKRRHSASSGAVTYDKCQKCAKNVEGWKWLDAESNDPLFLVSKALWESTTPSICCPAGHEVTGKQHSAGNCPMCKDKAKVTFQVATSSATMTENVASGSSDRRSSESSVPSNPLVEYPSEFLSSVVNVQGETDAAFGVYTDRGVVTLRHVIGKGNITIAPWFSPKITTVVSPTKVVPFPGSAELVLVVGPVTNACPIAISAFDSLDGVAAGGPARGAIVCPIGTASGVVSYKPSLREELVIAVGTKAGMCGCPYVVNGRIVGFHAYGHANKTDNGGLAMSPAHKTWLAAQQKN